MRQGAERIGVDLGTMRNSLRTDVETLISLVEADPWNPDAVQAHLQSLVEKVKKSKKVDVICNAELAQTAGVFLSLSREMP